MTALVFVGGYVLVMLFLAIIFTVAYGYKKKEEVSGWAGYEANFYNNELITTFILLIVAWPLVLPIMALWYFAKLVLYFVAFVANKLVAVGENLRIKKETK